MQSRAERIREALDRNPGITAVQLARNLDVSPQQIYQIRHDLKKKQLASRAVIEERVARINATRNSNAKPLSQHILDVLIENAYGMSDHQLHDAVVKAGYVSSSASFMTVLRAKLYNMVEVGRIFKNGTNYTHPKAVAPVAVVARHEPAPVAVAPKLEPENQQLTTLAMLTELSRLCKQAGGLENVQDCLNLIREIK